MIRFVVLFIIAGAGHAALAQEKAPFREGIEYRYDWEANITTESMESSALASSTHLRGQLFVVSRVEGSGWRALLKLKNVSTAVNIGSKGSAIKYSDLSELNNELGKPFQVQYGGSKITSAAFDDKEAVWSANFKRSIASLLQIQIEEDSVYTSDELSLYGKCTVNYYATKADNEIRVQKESDVNSCDGNFGRWRTFIHRSSCSAPAKNQNIGSSTVTTHYTVTPNRGYAELATIRSSGTIALDPFSLPKSAMVSKTSIELNLEKTKRSSGAPEPAIGKLNDLSDRLNFVFGHPYDKADPSKVDLKAAQNLMQHPEPLVLGQENLRRKSLIDIFSAVDLFSAESSDKKINLNSVALFSISYQLGSLDYNNLRALFRELTVTSGNEKLNSAKNVFLDLLLHSGSNAGIILLRDLIRDSKLDEYLAARLVAFAGAYVKQPTEKLLLEFQEVMDAKFANDQHKLYRNVAILAFANMLAKTCAPGSNLGVPCTANRLQTWQKTFYDKLITSKTFAERGLYVHALRNVGYGSFLEQLMQLVRNGVGDIEDDAQHLRVYIIHGFDQHRNEPKVKKLLIGVLRDSRENFQVRIAAASVLLDEPSVEILHHVQHVLKTDVGQEVRHFLISSLETMVQSYSPCLHNLKGLAKQILTLFDARSQSVRYSAAYAFDFQEQYSSVGSQLSVKMTSGEFDDVPAFINGKFSYFLKDSAYEPFGFTIRMSNMRKYMMDVMSSSLRTEDLNPTRLQELIEGFQFAARREKAISVDLSFTMHGNTLVFFSFDHTFFQDAIFTFSSLESIQDVALNLQRYLTAGALLYTQPNSLGLPTSFIFSAPILVSLKGAITKPKSSATFHRNVNLNFFGEIYADNGILTHFTPLNVTQGAVRNRKGFVNLPLSVELAADLKKMQIDFTYGVPTAAKTMEISTLSRTILTLRGSETSGALLQQLCPHCHPMVVVRDHSVPLKTETLANFTWPVIGMEAHLQQFDCESSESAGNHLGRLMSAFNPMEMNNNGLLSGWGFLSFLRIQHHFLLKPEGGHCGLRGRITQTKLYPVKEIATRFKLKINLNEEPEVAWQTGKMAVKAEIQFKGETPGTDRKGEIDVTYEYKLAGAKNNLNVRVMVNKIPFMNYKDWMICTKSESTFQPVVGDMIDISGYDQPPSAQAGIEFVMGETPQHNQCPTDQFRFKLNIKASAGSWVMERRSKADQWPYKQCLAESRSSNWVAGIVPQTEACYRSALDFTSLTNYNIDLRGAAVPHQVSTILGKMGDAIGLLFFPYGNWEQRTSLSNNTKDFGHMSLNVTYRPDYGGYGQVVDISAAVNNAVERYTQVPLPRALQFPLPSTNIPQSSRFAYESKAIPTCLVTSQYVQTLDNLTWTNDFTPCYSLVSSDCGSNPLYAVFARKTNGLYPLAVRVNVGGHNIEITPDESGRRKQFSVRANDLEIDVSDKSYTLPEGRNKFYVMKVRFQSPIYIISSPGAGLLVHYSGSHISVFPTWIHRNQHCGLCGNFDGELKKEFTAPQGCTLPNPTQFLASYTMGKTCFQEKPVCNL